MTKPLMAIVATAALVLIAVGCSDDAADESADDMGSTAAITTIATTDPSETTVATAPDAPRGWFDVVPDGIGDELRGIDDAVAPIPGDGFADGTDGDAGYDGSDGDGDGGSQVLAIAPTARATFVPITPYRAIDSRALGGDGLMYPGREVYFDATSDATGVQRIPPTAIAVTYNLTVTGTTGAGGFIALFPAGQPWPGNSSINWFTSGIDLANGGVVALGNRTGPGQVSFYAGQVSGASAYVILDITGYFA